MSKWARFPYTDGIVEDVLRRYVEGDSIKDIHEDLLLKGLKICPSTLYAWVNKATRKGYLEKVLIERICIGGPF